MVKKSKAPDRESQAWKLTEWVARFSSAVFARRFRPSHAVYEEIVSAMDSYGYTPDQIRLAYWAARCIPDEWIGNRLADGSMSPDVVVRHRAGINPTSGKPAKRWLDDLSSRIDEVNPVAVGFVLFNKVPEDMREGEKELLDKEGIKYEWTN